MSSDVASGEQLRTLCTSFSTYLYSFIILESRDGESLSITYVPYEYDYIDHDLDYDEEQYSEMVTRFCIQLEDLASDLVAAGTLNAVSISRGKMLFPNQHVLDSHVTIQSGQKTSVTYI